MPNTLVHIALQGSGAKAVRTAIDLRLVFLGCVIPDVPWIARRLIMPFDQYIDPYWSMMYASVQASLLFSLILAATASLLFRRSRMVFCVLAVNCLFHLVLDSLEVKPGNGVIFFAPFSWLQIQLDLVQPNSVLVHSLTLIGLALAITWLVTHRNLPLPPAGFAPNRITGAVVIVLIYVFVPFPLIEASYEQNNHYAKTLREYDLRPGRSIEIDRGRYFTTENGAFITTFTGEALRLIGEETIDADGVSLSGVFVDAKSIRVLDSHRSSAGIRDLASIIGLLLIAASWGLGFAASHSITIRRRNLSDGAVEDRD